MAEVPDHLVPTDGLCNYSVSFSKMEALERGSARFTFDFTEKGHYITSLSFDVMAEDDGLNGMMVRAHKKLIDALRQSLYIADVMQKAYEKQ